MPTGVSDRWVNEATLTFLLKLKSKFLPFRIAYSWIRRKTGVLWFIAYIREVTYEISEQFDITCFLVINSYIGELSYLMISDLFDGGSHVPSAIPCASS
ncbi:hypothetical protein AD949_00240 [Acetobacter orleanensis]|nr:hypothetical protein AD949_00240 [Acetobacter orleanensis]